MARNNIQSTGDPQADAYEKERLGRLSRAIKNIDRDDGDSLSTGKYRITEDGNLRKTGPTKPLDLYHGTPQPVGRSISEFRLKKSKDEDRPAVANLPAVYGTGDLNAATLYAHGLSADFNVGPRYEPQVYHLTMTPSEIVNLGDCEDGRAVNFAARLGADVIDCPQYDEQPESLATRADIVHIRRAVNSDTGAKVPIKPSGHKGRVDRRNLSGGRGGREFRAVNRRR